MKRMIETVALVTGGSSGIGRCTAQALRDAGCTVYEFSRRDRPLSGVTHMSVDVTDEAAVQAAVQRILTQSGHIDIVVNAAGFGISGAVELTPTDRARAQFDVNLFGLVHVNRAVLPSMRERQQGRIVNISSVAAIAHIPFQAFYSASKAAVSSYSCALDNEVRPYGIRVTAVELGDIHTGFTDARQKIVDSDQVYGERIARSVAQMEKDERSGMQSSLVGARIAHIALRRTCKPICTVGMQYRFLSLLCRLLPCSLRGWIVGRIYAR